MSKSAQHIVLANRDRRLNEIRSVAGRLQHLLLEDPLDHAGIRVVVKNSHDALGPEVRRFLTLIHGVGEREMRHQLRLFLQRLDEMLGVGKKERRRHRQPAVRPAEIKNQKFDWLKAAEVCAKTSVEKNDTSDEIPATWLSSYVVQRAASEVSRGVGLVVTPENLWTLTHRSSKRLGISATAARDALFGLNGSAVCEQVIRDIIYYITGRPKLGAILSPLNKPSVRISIDWNFTWQDEDGVRNEIQTRQMDEHPLLQHRQAGHVVAELIYRVHDPAMHAIIAGELARAREAGEYQQWFEWVKDKLGQAESVR